MSHIVLIRTQVRDPVAIEAACRRLQLPAPTRGTAKLFTSEASGVIVQLAPCVAIIDEVEKAFRRRERQRRVGRVVPHVRHVPVVT